MSLDPIAKQFADDYTGKYKQRWLTCAQIGFGHRKHVPQDLLVPFLQFVQGRAGLNEEAVNRWIWTHLYNAKLRNQVPPLPQVPDWNDHVRTLRAAQTAANITGGLIRGLGKLIR